MKSALIVGGTGPSGPFLVNGLRERGYKAAAIRGTFGTVKVAPALNAS